jgi:hypothetical protein
MNAITVAYYLVLSFPGVPHAVTTIPMTNAAICEAEKKSIQTASFAHSGNTTQVFAHCVKTGYEAR